MRPCTCNNCDLLPGGVYTPDQCRLCWLYFHDPVYRAAWDRDAGPADSAPRSLPCFFLGPVIDRAGSACPARWRRCCARHGTCTLEQCKQCPDYETA